MRRLSAVLVAIAGLALPVGLALAVYLTSASTIAATPPRSRQDPAGEGEPAGAAGRLEEGRQEARPQVGRWLTGDDDGGGQRGLLVLGHEQRHEHRGQPLRLGRQRWLGRQLRPGRSGAPTTAPARTRAPARSEFGLRLRRFRRATTSPPRRLNQVFTRADRTFTGNAPALNRRPSTVDGVGKSRRSFSEPHSTSSCSSSPRCWPSAAVSAIAAARTAARAPTRPRRVTQRRRQWPGACDQVPDPGCVPADNDPAEVERCRRPGSTTPRTRGR